MKKAYHYTSWRINDDDQFCGVNFGYDFAAEHESGISGIRTSFGIKTYNGNTTINSIKKMFGALKPAFGIEARIIKEKPASFTIKQKGDFCCIYYSSSFLTDTVFEDGIKSLSWEMSKANGKDLVCYWGENSFMLITTNQANFQELKKAFNNLTIAIFTAGKDGLVLALSEKLDAKTKSDLMSSDYNAWELKKEAENLGIEEALIKAKKEYHALRPAWKDDKKTVVHFWLNPYDQQKYNHGWYSVEELKDWINEKGPIIKTLETIKDGTAN